MKDTEIPYRLARFLCGGKPCPHHEQQGREVYDEILVLQAKEREKRAAEALDRLAAAREKREAA